MRSFNEWNRLNLTFAEKVTLLQNRIYAISSAYSTLSYSTSAYPVVAVGGALNPPADPMDIMNEIDEIWNEMKSDLKAAKKAKPKK